MSVFTAPKKAENDYFRPVPEWPPLLSILAESMRHSNHKCLQDQKVHELHKKSRSFQDLSICATIKSKDLAINPFSGVRCQKADNPSNIRWHTHTF